MVEIYLFVNPLGGVCLEIEKEIIQLSVNDKKKIQLRFIPLLNMKTINEFLSRQHIPINDIKRRNRIFEDLYSAALDYKAAQLQGRKKDRQLLIGLQKAVAEDGLAYSPELSEELLLAAGGDIDMYRKDRQSDFVKESFQTDQKVAREMGIKQHPTAVVYNYTCENDFGILVENFENMDEIKQLCRVHPHNEPLLNQGDATFEFKRRSNYHFPNGHLHLL